VANTYILMVMSRLKGICMQLSRIFEILMIRMGKWENHLKDFFRYFSLTLEQKCHYTLLTLARDVYLWWKDSHIDCRDWLILQELLHNLVCFTPQGPQFNDLVAECKKILTGIVKMLESKAVEVVEDSEPEPEINDRPGPEVAAELVSPQEEVFPRPMKVVRLSIEILVDLPVEPTMELAPSLTVIRASIFLRSPDVYDPLQIFLQKLVSQEIGTLICGLDVNGVELTCHAVYLARALVDDCLFVTKAGSTFTTLVSM